MHKLIPHDAILIPEKAKRVFKGVIYDVYQWQQENFDDSVATFEMLKRPDTVSAICIVNDAVVVLDDEQPHSGSKLTFPGGRVDKADPDPLAAAKREILEETGYEFASWRLVGVMQPFAKLEWFVFTYVAWDVLGQSATNHDAGERITAELKAFDELKELAKNEAGFLGESRRLLEHAERLEDLKHLPECKGVMVDR
jgi:8-oxo-dGTP pyrophosphatase MutT (NUDIX family)